MHELIKYIRLVNSFCIRNLEYSVQIIHLFSSAHIFSYISLFILIQIFTSFIFFITKQVMGDNRCFSFVFSLEPFLSYNHIYLRCNAGHPQSYEQNAAWSIGKKLSLGHSGLLKFPPEPDANSGFIQRCKRPSLCTSSQIWVWVTK